MHTFLIISCSFLDCHEKYKTNTFIEVLQDKGELSKKAWPILYSNLNNKIGQIWTFKIPLTKIQTEWNFD